MRFYPVGQLAWPNAPKLPLGDAYAGLCQADPVHESEPGLPALRDLCNLGYARGRCARFPPGDGPDAVRFSVERDRDGLIRICWVREKDHRPFDHGPLEYSLETHDFSAAPVDAAVVRQAHAYISSYLRRKTRQRGEA